MSRKTLDEVLASNPNAIKFMDVNLRPSVNLNKARAYLKKATHAKINEEELADILGQPRTTDQKSLEKYAKDLLRQYPNLKATIITMGEKGAFTMESHNTGVVFSVTPKKIEIPAGADAVGAGDSFASVVIYGITRGWGWQTTMQRAAELGALMVQRAGPTIPPKEFGSFYGKLKTSWGEQ